MDSPRLVAIKLYPFVAEAHNIFPDLTRMLELLHIFVNREKSLNYESNEVFGHCWNQRGKTAIVIQKQGILLH
jgi:hypothetical protein